MPDEMTTDGDGAGEANPGLRDLIAVATPLLVGRWAMIRKVFGPEIAAFRVYLELIEHQQDQGVGPTDD